MTKRAVNGSRHSIDSLRWLGTRARAVDPKGGHWTREEIYEDAIMRRK